jgi:hypothetical protein
MRGTRDLDKAAFFRIQVRLKMPPGVSQKSAAMAMAFYCENGLIDHEKANVHEYVRLCIDLARRFDSSPAGTSSQAGIAPFEHLSLAPHDLMSSDDLAEQIRPAVEQVRSELFGSPHPPFAAPEEAIQWLEQTAAELEVQARANKQAPEALQQTILEMLERYRGLTGETVDNPFKLEFLEYVKPGNPWVRRMPVWEETPLATLRDKSRWLANATGFAQAGLVSYILAGIRPLLASVSIGMSWGYNNELSIFRGSVTMTLHSPYVTAAQWRESRKFIRRAWGTEKKKPLTQGKKQLLDIVQHHGGVPKDKGHGEHTTFFEEVRQEYNLWAVKHNYMQHKNWRVTRNAYQRLLKKTRSDGPLAMGFLDGNH